jgi:hypothetical protein
MEPSLGEGVAPGTALPHRPHGQHPHASGSKRPTISDHPTLPNRFTSRPTPEDYSPLSAQGPSSSSPSPTELPGRGAHKNEQSGH